MLIACVYRHHRNREDEFRTFAFTDIGEDLDEMSKIEVEFRSNFARSWSPSQLYDIWRDQVVSKAYVKTCKHCVANNIKQSGTEFIRHNAAKYGYFLDNFTTFPAFETVESTERNYYVYKVGRYLLECNNTPQGLKRPSVQQWLEESGKDA